MTEQERYLKILKDESQVQVGQFLVALSTGAQWMVEYNGYLVASFEYDFQEEAVAFAQSVNEADVEEKLKHNWEWQPEWNNIPIPMAPYVDGSNPNAKWENVETNKK